MAKNQLKILVCGDVGGKFAAFTKVRRETERDDQSLCLFGLYHFLYFVLFQRLSSVNSKSGPFEMLLCVGSFFSNRDIPETENDSQREKEDKNIWKEIKEGKRKVDQACRLLHMCVLRTQ